MAIWQGKVTREHNVKSVKPFLVPNITLLEKEIASLTFTNKGIGPAFIESLFFYSEDAFERITNFDDMRALLKRSNLDPDGSIVWKCTVWEKGSG